MLGLSRRLSSSARLTSSRAAAPMGFRPQVEAGELRRGSDKVPRARGADAVVPMAKPGEARQVLRGGSRLRSLIAEVVVIQYEFGRACQGGGGGQGRCSRRADVVLRQVEAGEPRQVL